MQKAIKQIDSSFDEKKPIFPEPLRAWFLLENAGLDDHERSQVLASVQNKYVYHSIQQALGMQFDKKHERDNGNKFQNRWQHRHKGFAAEGEEDFQEEEDEPYDDGLEELLQDASSQSVLAAAEDEDVGITLQEIVDQAGDDDELRQELLEGAVFAAAQHGQRSFKQARELLRQKKTNRKFFGPRKFHGASGKGPGSQASTRGPPSAASTSSSKLDSDAWKTDPNTMCLRFGGYGHIAKNCKAPAKLQHGRRYNNLSS